MRHFCCIQTNPNYYIKLVHSGNNPSITKSQYLSFLGKYKHR